MANSWREKALVNEYVDLVATSSIVRFYPTSVAKYADTSLEKAFKYLIEMAEDDKVNLLWELRCPTYECMRTIQIVKNKSDIIDEFTCKICGESYEVNAEMYFPAFEINLEYKNYVRSLKNNIKKKTLSLSI